MKFVNSLSLCIVHISCKVREQVHDERRVLPFGAHRHGQTYHGMQPRIPCSIWPSWGYDLGSISRLDVSTVMTPENMKGPSMDLCLHSHLGLIEIISFHSQFLNLSQFIIFKILFQALDIGVPEQLALHAALCRPQPWCFFFRQNAEKPQEIRHFWTKKRQKTPTNIPQIVVGETCCDKQHQKMIEDERRLQYF